jgi:hypothetical protein
MRFVLYFDRHRRFIFHPAHPPPPPAHPSIRIARAHKSARAMSHIWRITRFLMTSNEGRTKKGKSGPVTPTQSVFFSIVDAPNRRWLMAARMSPYANCSRLLLVCESKKAQCGCITPERIAIAHRISGPHNSAAASARAFP